MNAISPLPTFVMPTEGKDHLSPLSRDVLCHIFRHVVKQQGHAVNLARTCRLLRKANQYFVTKNSHNIRGWAATRTSKFCKLLHQRADWVFPLDQFPGEPTDAPFHGPRGSLYKFYDAVAGVIELTDFNGQFLNAQGQFLDGRGHTRQVRLPEDIAQIEQDMALIFIWPNVCAALILLEAAEPGSPVSPNLNAAEIRTWMTDPVNLVRLQKITELVIYYSPVDCIPDDIRHFKALRSLIFNGRQFIQST